MRHSYAVPSGPYLSDSNRWLSRDGRDTARQVGRVLSTEKVSVDLVFTSPLVRAVQTAELVSGRIDYIGEIEAMAGLAPGCEPELAADAIVAHNADALIVGHAPTISALGAYLLGRPSFPPFLPGMVCGVEQGEPLFKIRPDALIVEPLFIA